MAKRPSRQGVATGILILLLAGALVSQTVIASATHQPANKVAAGGSTIMNVPPAAATGSGSALNNIIGPVSVKTSKPTDLVFHVTLECSILTEVTSDNNAATGTAEGQIRVWVVLDGTTIVPINQTSSPPQDPPTQVGSDTDKVTFCNRRHELQQTDAENPADGIDTVRSFIKTKDANAFNWVRLNLGSGLHTIEVRADLAKAATNGTADGFVGNRTLVISPEKFANDIVI